MTVAAMTVLCVDFYERQGTVCVGGNSLNFAVQCKKSGVADVALIGAIGNDEYGQAVIGFIDDRGIDRSHVETRAGVTASNRILIDEKGDRYFPPNAWNGGVYQNFVLSEADWDFVLSRDIVAIPANNNNFMETVRRVGPANLLAGDFLDMREYALMNRTIPMMDLAFVSGDDDVCGRMRELSKSCRTVITVTLGSRGSKSFFKGNDFFTEAVKVDNVTDTTGCGDAYQAAFSVSFYHNRDILSAMRAGSEAAAEILKHIGAAGA